MALGLVRKLVALALHNSELGPKRPHLFGNNRVGVGDRAPESGFPRGFRQTREASTRQALCTAIPWAQSRHRGSRQE